VNGYTEANFGTGSRPDGFDTDRDGIPDDWELANGLNPNSAADAALFTVDSEKMYSNLEVYLNALVEDIMKACQAGGDDAVSEYYPEWKKPGEEPGEEPTVEPGDTEAEPVSYVLSKETNTGSNTTAVYNFKDDVSIGNQKEKKYAEGYENGVKYSAGVKYTINLPENVSISSITFTGYDNYPEADSYIGEVAGTKYDADDYVFPKKDENGDYTLATHTIDFSTPLSGTISFTPQGKQVVLVISLVGQKTVKTEPDPGTEPDPVPGDVDGSGTADAADVTALAAHLAGLTPEGFVGDVADVNQDGTVDIADVAALIAIILNANDNPNDNENE
jgi:hypothetical protein